MLGNQLAMPLARDQSQSDCQFLDCIENGNEQELQQQQAIAPLRPALGGHDRAAGSVSASITTRPGPTVISANFQKGIGDETMTLVCGLSIAIGVVALPVSQIVSACFTLIHNK